jgi:aarF domain-containing kinase
MASRRLLDLFAIANTSAAVVRKHFLIRSHQLNHYAATSSILKARVQPIRRDARGGDNEVKGGPTQDHNHTPYPTTTTQTPSRGEAPIPATETLNSEATVRKEGIAQDHQYARGEGIIATHTKTTEDAKRLQHQYEHTIPRETADPPVIPESHADAPGQEGTNAKELTKGMNGDLFYLRHAKSSDVVSNLPRVKIPRHPEGEQPASSGGINAMEFTRNLQEKGEDREMEGLGAQVFQSRRARGLFGVKPNLQALKPEWKADEPAAKYRATAENKPTHIEQTAQMVTDKARRNHLQGKEIEQAVAEEAQREQVKVDEMEIKEIAAEISQGVREFNDRVRLSPLGTAPHAGGKLTQSSTISSSQKKGHFK